MKYSHRKVWRANNLCVQCGKPTRINRLTGKHFSSCDKHLRLNAVAANVYWRKKRHNERHSTRVAMQFWLLELI
jgi:hypothetical protein